MNNKNEQKEKIVGVVVGLILSLGLSLQPVAWAVEPQPTSSGNGTYTPVVNATPPQPLSRGRFDDSPVFQVNNPAVLLAALQLKEQNLNSNTGRQLAGYITDAAKSRQYFDLRGRFEPEVFWNVDLDGLKRLFVTTVDPHQVVEGRRTTLWTAEADATFKELPTGQRGWHDPQIRVKITPYKEPDSAGRIRHYVRLQLLTVLTQTHHTITGNDNVPGENPEQVPSVGTIWNGARVLKHQHLVSATMNDLGTNLRSITVVSTDTTRDLWEAKIEVVKKTGRTYYLNVRKPTKSEDGRWLGYDIRRYLLG